MRCAHQWTLRAKRYWAASKTETRQNVFGAALVTSGPLQTFVDGAANDSKEPDLTNAVNVANVCFDDFVSERFAGSALLSINTDTCHFHTDVK
jgi:hypothetical protein